MAKVKIEGNASGSGTFTIAAPNSNTDRVLTLPDEAGTVLTSGGAIDVDASAPADSIAIDSSGNVGIGTSSPSSKLEVVYSNSGVQGLILKNTGVTGSPRLFFSDSSSTCGIFQDSNNLQFLTNSTPGTTSGTERMRIDSSGRVTMPYQPSFRAYRTSSTTSTGNVIIWPNTFHNTGNHFNTTTGVFTAPVAGVYAVSLHYLTENSSTQVDAHVRVNGVINNGIRMRSAGAANHKTTSATHAIYLHANDTIDVYFEAGGTFYSDSSYAWTEFSAHLLS